MNIMPRKFDFGKYVLVEKIANGGMAEIYKAKYFGESGFEKNVAVKRVLPVWSDRKDFEKMLVDEAKALVHLQHQNIVQVYELGRDREYFYISMEYVDGVDLKALYRKVEGRGVPDKCACFIIMEVLKGLEFAHRKRNEDGEFLNIVHRDVSPQNILLSYNGEVKLTDFGIAKGLHREKETTTAQIKGKYSYMSPEQAFGKDVDHRSDLFSVGVVFYEILTGMRLFESDNDFDTIQKVREKVLPFDWEGYVTLGIRQILHKALAKDPDKRYQTAADFIKDLDNYVKLKRLGTHNLELSDYLNRLFADDKNNKIVENVVRPKKTKMMRKKVHKKKISCQTSLKRRYAAMVVLFMPFFIAAVFRPEMGGDSVIVEEVKQFPAVLPDASVPKAEGIPKSPGFSEINEGMIRIETVPSGAAGALNFAGKRKNFTTPFAIPGVNLSKPIAGKIMISKDGYKTVVDKLSLSKDEPIFSKTYELKSNAPGRIGVQVRPWGYVQIPGVLSKRESPVRGVNIKPGRYKVKIHYPPTNAWAVADVNVKAGRTHRCYADFTSGKKISCR